ncbi:AMIN domain-containing protein [Chromohalobacter moromii]|uniref:AMIN domain-containing protein n=1 Tax=Chromohalobacter moromii TaxID=2860329 RepID=A0A9X2X4K5_9GAMM|nr:AMIN domain-containing protein [Chromohalobacter moromii]MCK2047058.1 AMIN domain-containing protein [Chromohalobacter moromii]MCT8506635.1 AMIN domain-containing protein [Chromohalobacter moromii]
MDTTSRLAQVTLGVVSIVASGQAYSIDLELSEHLSDTAIATFQGADSDHTVFTLEDPKRIVVDIEDYDTMSSLSISGARESKIVEEVRHGIRGGNQLRVVFDIADQYDVASVEQWKESSQIRVAIEAYPQEDCTPNAIDLNICDKAQEISSAITARLPMSITQNLTIEKVIPSGGTLNIFGLLSYDRIELQRMGAQQGLSMSDMQDRTESYTANMACDENLGMTPFIELGGKLNYHYRFSDGIEYKTVVVDSCQ